MRSRGTLHLDRPSLSLAIAFEQATPFATQFAFQPLQEFPAFWKTVSEVVGFIRQKQPDQRRLRFPDPVSFLLKPLFVGGVAGPWPRRRSPDDLLRPPSIRGKLQRGAAATRIIALERIRQLRGAQAARGSIDSLPHSLGVRPVARVILPWGVVSENKVDRLGIVLRLDFPDYITLYSP